MSPQFEEFSGDHTRVRCPFCAESRRKSRLKEMTLTRQHDGAILYFCHHCEASGAVQPRKQEFKLSAVPSPAIVNNALTSDHYAYLSERGISKATADKARLFSAEKFFSRLGKQAQAIGFPYYRSGALVAAKYRSFPDKDFTQDAGGAHDFFNIDNVDPTQQLIIVEGEIDCLTLIEAGFTNVVSVPGGAPIKVADGKVLPTEDKKFAYVWNARDIIEAVPSVILATDQDGPGQALAEELARRIGKEKCRVAKFAFKDLNEAFLHDDPTQEPRERVAEILEQAQPYPISGLSDATAYADRLNDLFSKGTGSGFSTGYPSLDTIYTVAPGQLTVVTGYPSSGKSNFVDQLMVNLAQRDDWKFAVASFENQPEIHISRLMEIHTRKRFFDGKERMSEAEMQGAFKWVNDHFLFLDAGGEEPNTLDSLLERARAAVKRMGIRGMVIDPYNYIDLPRDGTETEAISQMLTRVQKFCKANDVHVWFVAHPAKINRSGMEQPRPDGMAIAGSMAWWAKTDVGVTVHRQEGAVVEIAVWKCRYRWVGTQGETTLLYNKTAGTYSENLDQF